MRTTIMLLLAAAAVSACCAADYDGYVSLRGDGSWAGVPAFMTNVVDLAQGWDDERDPHGDADYVVKGNTCLATPEDQTTSTCYEFPGHSLTIDSTFDANRGIRFYTSRDASVKFKSLTLRGGVIQLAYANATPQTIRGNVSVDLSDKSKPFRIKGGTHGQSWHFREGTLSSGCDDVIESSVDYSEKPVHFWVHDDVDASGYCGTFRVWWSKVLHVECPRFGGAAEASSTGVVSYAASGVSISNVWLSAKGAKLTFDAANMNGYADHLEMTNGSTVAFLAGTTLTVGTLDYQGGTLDFTKGGLLALTNGYSRTKPIEIVVPLASSAMRTAALVTLPVSAGTLRAEDFTASQTVGNCQYQFRVRTVGGLQSLYLENLLPCGANATNWPIYTNSNYYVH